MQDQDQDQDQPESSLQSHSVSREDTMVEHSVVVNEEAIEEPLDYMQALQSVKFD